MWAGISSSISTGWETNGMPVLVKAHNSWCNKSRAENCAKVVNKSSEICVRSSLALLAVAEAGALGAVSGPCFMEKKCAN